MAWPGIFLSRVTRGAAAVLLAVVLAAARDASADTVGANPETFLRDLARELVAKVGTGRFRGRTIAVEPFPSGRGLVVDETAADRLSEGFLTALQDALGEETGFTSDRDIRDLLIRAHREFATDKDYLRKANHLFETRRVDILIHGDLARQRSGITLSFRAVSRGDGKRLGATAARTVPPALLPPSQAMPEDQAMEAAARDVSGALCPIGTLFYRPLAFEKTGIVTSFGAYLAEELARRLQRRDDCAVGQRMAIRELRMEARRWAGEDEAALLRTTPRSHVLSGDYFPGDKDIRVSLEVRDAEGRGRAWSGVIARETIPPGMQDGLFLRSEWQHPWTTEDRPGPVRFRIKPDRREYRLEEPMRLQVELDREAWVYCFVWDEGGAVSKVFPSRAQPSVRLERGSYLLPDALMPADAPAGARVVWPAGEPTGRNVFKCFATPESVETRLPSAIAGTYQGVDVVVPGGSERAVLDAFRRLAGTPASEASATVNVRR